MRQSVSELETEKAKRQLAEGPLLPTDALHKHIREAKALPRGVTYVPAKETECSEATWEARMHEHIYDGRPMQNVRASYYYIRIRLSGKSRSLGTSVIATRAGRIYDSALFYCWSFSDRPRVSNFNFYKPGDKQPELFDVVKTLRAKLEWEAGIKAVPFTPNPNEPTH
jgi:hypothetical protein